MTTNLSDQHGRHKRKLRISVTDRCNFRCPYCLPETPEWLPREQILSFEEIGRLAGLFVSRLGIRHIRLTGGEPLLRKNLADLVARLQSLRNLGLERLSMTSNGFLLPAQAASLRKAGLDDINISLDSLDAERFVRLSGGRGSPEAVCAGIEAARDAGLPVKLNTVIVRGYNEQDIRPLTEWAMRQGLPLRFIEFMPLDDGSRWNKDKVISEAEIIAELGRQYPIHAQAPTSEPANYYWLNDSFRVGVIPTISNPFCKRCDRLRLTATGELFACLFSPSGRDLRSPLREAVDDNALEAIIRGHVWHKEAGYALKPGYVERPITMHALGG